MSPADMPAGVGKWRRGVVRFHNIRKTAEKKQAELNKQLRETQENDRAEPHAR